MKLRFIRKNGNLYVKLLLAITVGVVITLIASSTVYFVSFTRTLQQKAFESDVIDLKHTAHAVAITTENAQTVSFQIYRNSTIAKILYYNDPHPFDIQGAMLELNNYLNSMPFIHSIYVYNAAQDRYYIVSQQGQRGDIEAEMLQDTSVAEILDNFNNYKPFAPIPRLINVSEGEEDSTPIYTYLCYDAIGRDGSINSAILVNVTADWINQNTFSESKIQNLQTFVIDNDNTVRSLHTSAKPLRNEEITNQLLSLPSPSSQANYTIAQFNNQKSLITYTAKDTFDWYYVRVTPYEDVIAEVSIVGIRTLQFAGIILVAGLLLSWLLSRQVYKPINQIKVRMESLESEQRNSSYTIRQDALYKLLQLQHFNPKIQLDKLKRIGIQFNFTKPYFVVCLRIDKFQQIKMQSQSDILTYKFAIMNIATEICSKHMQVEALDLEDDCLLLFLTMNQHSLLESGEIQLLLKEVQVACEQYLRLGITIALSSPCEEPHQLHSSFKRVKEASLHRFFAGYGAIIDIDKLPLEVKGHNFPIGKEKRLIEALKTGKNEEAKQLFHEILQETKYYPFHKK